MFDIGREVTSNPATATQREWLVSNGIGGFAAGTVANVPTRRYHGLLLAALNPPLGRTLLLSKLDESATYDERTVPLFATQWNHGAAPLQPPGFLHLERFHLEGTTPVWTFAIGDARLEKRVWMQHGANTTYIRYDVPRSTLPLHLDIKALVNYRDYHSTTRAGDWRMRIEPVCDGLKVIAFDGATPFFLLSDRADAISQHDWYRHYFLAREADRGLDTLDDNLYAGHFHITLHAGESVTLVASTEPDPELDGATAHAARRTREQQLVEQSGQTAAPPWVQHLVLAADQFIVRRAAGEHVDGRSIIAGYPWFGDWGRDTMISLPGLTLVTGRHNEAATLLRTYAQFVDRGMIPNRFPDSGPDSINGPEYNTVDATLWSIHAVHAYYRVTGDDALLRELYPVLRAIIEWHQRGTRYHIQVDAADGLLYAGEAGVQLTWMDAKVGDWVVTPRMGKPVEINALWYNALCTVRDFAHHLGEAPDLFDRLAGQAQTGFARFWNGEMGYCYDVLDGPAGDDPALRPNQLLAVSLPHSPLPLAQQRAVVDICARRLLTSLGLRSLGPDHAEYVGQYRGGPDARDGAYHQGTAWAWLIGPFVDAHLRVYGDPVHARSFLQPLINHLHDFGIGSICEIGEGDPPHAPRGCIAQAWSVAEVLRAWSFTHGVGHSDARTL